MNKRFNILKTGWQFIVDSLALGETGAVDRSISLESLEDRVLYDASPLAGLMAPAEPVFDVIESMDQHFIQLQDQVDQALADYFLTNEVVQLIDRGDAADFDHLLASNSNFSEPDSGHEVLQLVVIDEGVDNYQQLIDDLRTSAASNVRFEIIQISQTTNGIERLTQALGGSKIYDAVHIVSHGSGSQWQLGNAWLNRGNMDDYQQQFTSWSAGLTADADILIYGCDLASTNDGQFLLAQIGSWTGADIAASDDLTGHGSLGGDWEFEYVYGQIETRLAFSIDVQSSWMGTLDITTSLIMHNTFDTNANDSSGNNYHGTLTNGALIDTTGGTNKIGGGKLSLDGNNDYVDFSAHATNFQAITQGSIAVWIYHDVNDRDVIFEMSDSGDADSRLALFRDTDGSFDFYVREGSTTLVDVSTAAGAIAQNTWTHVAVTVDATGNKLYVNGVQQGGLTYAVGSATTNSFFDDVTQLDFGSWGVDKYSGSNFVRQFDGFLDDGRVYGRALSGGDVNELYNMGLASTSTINVTNTSDVISAGANTSSLAALFANSGGDGVSLREAIAAANNQAGTDTINFNIAGTGVHTINVGSTMTITGATIINATTDDSFAVNSNRPAIILDGNNSFSGDGFVLSSTADGSTIRGFVIRDFTGNGITIQAGSDGNTIAGNYIGRLTATGSDAGAAEANTSAGIDVRGNNNTIGGITAADRNVIAGNVDGIYLLAANNNLVFGNYIGLDATGATSLGNTGRGISVDASTGTQVGNGLSTGRNIISGNTGDGVYLFNSAGTIVRGNYIGTDVTGTLSRGNTGYGILASASNSSIIDANVISGNTLGGLSLWGTSSATVTSNYIGTNAAGTAQLGNLDDGIKIGGGSNNNLIGGDRTAGKGNVISGNIGANSDGIEISGSTSGAANNQIYGNYIGTNAAGTAAIANGRHGVAVYNGAQGTLIGGIGTGQGNVISGNTAWGIAADGNSGSTTTGTTIVANFIGLNLAGISAIANGSGGITMFAGASSSTIGGNTSAHRNVIAGGQNGIVLNAATGVVIAGNYIGTDATGNTVIAISADGIRIENGSTGNTVGGATSASRNIIAGVSNDGIEISGETSDNNVIRNNWIGVSANGLTNLGTGNTSIYVNGGADGTSILENVMAGSFNSSVWIGGVSSGTVIQGNYIGTNSSQSTTWGPRLHGIELSDGAFDTTIGGTGVGAGNVIAYSGTGSPAFDGVRVQSTAGTGNAILGNTIYGSAELGIDLGNGGVTANDTGDGDTGPNNLQNFPVITSAVSNGSQITINGTINSTANSYFRVEFFANTANDASGYGEGQRYLGFTNVATDGSGNGTFSQMLVQTVAGGEFISATATKSNITYSTFTDTSEFALSYAATSTNIAPTDIVFDSETGAQQTVNTYGTSDQIDPAIAAFSNGGYIVVWVSNGQDGSGYGIYGQRYNANGTVNGVEFLVTSETTDSETNPSVATFADGGFVVSWQDQISGVRAFTEARVFNANGTAATADFTVSPGVDGNNEGYQPTVVALNSTQFVVVWANEIGNTTYEVAGRIYDRTGSAVGAQFTLGSLISSSGLFGAQAEVTLLNDGGFAATWRTHDGTNTGTRMRVMNANGTARSAEITVATGDSIADISSLSNGNFVVSYDSVGALKANIYNASGTVVSSGIAVNTTLSAARFESTVTRSDDGFVVVWESSTGDGSGSAILAQRFDNAGVKIGGEVLVNQTTSGNQQKPEVIETSSGKVIAVWQSDNVDAALTGIASRVVATGTASVVENAANGTRVADVLGVLDANTGDTRTYSLFNNAGGRFQINSTTGLITVLDGSLLDYETATSHNITVRVTDSGGLTYDEVLTISVTDVNDAPVLNNGTLVAVAEDTANPSGATVSSVFSGQFSDVDAGSSFGGIAVVGNTANPTTQGVWQYSTDGGTSWYAIGTVADGATALALNTTTRLRFVPVADYNGTPTALTTRGLDNTYGGGFTSGASRTNVNTSSNGGSTSISGSTADVNTSITAVNDAPSFNSGTGLVTTGFVAGASDFINAIAIQPDGKIVAVGYTQNAGNNDFAIVRYNADGSLDTSFGGGTGKVTTAIGISSETAQSVVILSSGKILVTGSALISGSWDIALVQYNANGTLDTSFGGGTGIATSGIAGSDEGYGLAVQSDGKILVAGGTNNDFLLARFLSNGSLDTSFGTSGRVTTDFAASNDRAQSMSLQADGKILLGGYAVNGVSFDFAVARYNTDGTLDTTFNGTGKATVDLGTNSSDSGRSLTLQTDGKILIAGWSDAGGTNDFGLVRLNANGSLDTTFNGTGKVTTAIGTGSDLGLNVTVQADGKILMVGQSNTAGNNFAAVRYNTNGSLDTTFNGTGKVDTNFGGSSDDRGQAIAVQTDGKIVLAGTSTINGNHDFAVARYNTDGTLDTRFNTSNTLGGTIAYTENAAAVVLDNDVSIFDAELSSLNNFSGSTLTLTRNGGANGEDVFSATGSLATLTQGGSLVVGGTTIGTVTTNSGGTLLLTFNSNATQTLVNSAMRLIAYSNSNDAPPASVQVNWTFNDGNSGAQGTGGALTATGNTTINISAVNDAPTITNAAVYNYTGINEDSTSAGVTVTTIVNSAAWADPDTGAVRGMAITGRTGNGTWQYSTDGTTWNTFGAVTGSNALLLSATTQIRYIGDNANGETATFSYRAWDTTTGTASTNATQNYGNAGAGGGTTAYSSQSATGQIVTTNVNDAPLLDNSGTMTLTTINEDQTTNGGNTIASIIASAGGDRITDVDTGAVEGIAITSLVSGNGTWEYSTNAGGSWTAIGAVSNSSALLLRDTDLVRFVPDGQNATSGSFDFRAWDQTNGGFGTKVNASTNGGTTAFSSAIETAGITVTAVNDAPTAVNDNVSTDENSVVNAAALGLLANDTDVDALLAGSTLTYDAASGGGSTWADSTGVAGFDMTFVNFGSETNYKATTTSGYSGITSSYEFSGTNSGAQTTSLAFFPGSPQTKSVSFEIWFRTDTLTGEHIVFEVGGEQNGTSLYLNGSFLRLATRSGSGAADEVAVDLTGIYIDPTAEFIQAVAVIDKASNQLKLYVDGQLRGATSFTGTNGSAWSGTDSFGMGMSTSDVVPLPAAGSGNLDGEIAIFRMYEQVLTVTEIDNNFSAVTGTALKVSAVEGSAVNVGSQITLASGALLTVNENGSYSYDPNGQFEFLGTGDSTTDSFTYTVADNGGLTDTATVTITINGVNDAPVLDNAGTMTLTTINEDQTTNVGNTIASIITSAGGDRITDVDSGAVEGIAITSLVSGNGTWEYSTNAGGTWTAIGAVSNTTALLLRETDLVRFVPNAQNSTAGSIDFRAWDQTSGTFGTKVDVSTNGGTTAFSSVVETADIAVTAVNDAPTITASTYSYTGINEDSTSAGVTVTTIVDSATWADIDNGAVRGMAITGSTGNGTWEYSTDGVTWNTFGAVSGTNALLLNATTQLRYVGDTSNGETATFSYRAWDTTTGTASTNATQNYGNPGAGGGTTAYSSQSATGQIITTSVNDAPTIASSYMYNLTGTNEDTTSSGTLASAILTASTWADVDTGALSGLAITGNTGNGTWQYSTDGTTWNAFGAVTSTNSLLISSTTQIRYIPDSNNGETATFSYKAWDRTTGSPSTNASATYVSTASSGGTTAFSANTDTAQMVVTSVNDAPMYDTNGSTSLLTITEDQTNSAGQTVAAIIASAGGNRITDFDTGAVEGIAIRNANAGNGTWQYSLNGGSTWIDVGVVANSSALLLRDTDMLRFVPDGNNGTTALLSVRAWDQTAGVAGTKVDTGVGGGATAFSAASEIVDMTVTDVNDAPTIASSYTYNLTGTNEDTTSSGTLASAILTAATYADVDTGAVSGLAITTKTGSGTWQYSTDGVTWNAFGAITSTNALLITSTTQVRYIPVGDNGETATFTFKAWDRTTGTASTNATANFASTASSGGTTAFSTNTDSAQMVVTSVNDAPTITNGAVYNYTGINEDSTSSGVTVTTIVNSASWADVDSGAVRGMAITGRTGNGTWQYSTDGTTWNTFGAVTGSNALLLSATTQLRYIGDNANGETATFSYRAWDTTTGTASTNATQNYGNPGVGGTSTAYSSQSAMGQIVTTSVNDAPVLDNSGTMTLTTINEDATSNGGNTIASIIASAGGDRITDVDAGAVEGVAIATLVSGNGTWQYSTNAGSSWTDIGVVSNASALLLRQTDLVRFVPNAMTGTTASFDFRAWDQTNGAFGTKVDVSTNGGATAFSTAVETAEITVTDINDEQVLSTNTGTTVLEGSSGNVITTTMLQTTDVDNTAAQLVYTVTTVPVNGVIRRSGINLSVSSTFTQSDIDAGIITYLHNDTETTSDSFSFTVDDGVGTTSSGTFNIAVTPVNDNSTTAISDTNGTADFVLENAATGTVVGVTAFATDGDIGDTITYSLDDNAGGLFGIDSNTGIVTVAGAIDRETAASYNITVRATSSDTSATTRVFTIAIGDVDEYDVSTPTDSNVATNEVDENVAIGTTVGVTANAFDLDATTNTITYSLTSNPDGLFQIDANTGVVTTAAAINRELHGALRSITVQAASSDGSTATQSFSIAINDLDEFDASTPTDSNGTTNEVDENVTIGTTVGITANAFDLDATTNTITYDLTSNVDGLFQVDANTGVVTTAAAIDRELHGATRSITVRATSSDGSTASQSFNIAINDLDEFDVTSVSDSDGSANTVAENATIGTTVGIAAFASDADATTNTITYTLDDSAGGLFAIDGSTGVVTVAAGLDFETSTSHNITIRATSADGSFSSQLFTISVTDVNESGVSAISDSDGTLDYVLENATVGTAVGITAFADDVDGTDTVSYSLDDTAGGRFSVDSSTGIVTVAGGIDREAAGTYNITVRATSTDTSTITRVFTITIGDVDEFDVTVPADSDGATNAVDENVAIGTTVGVTANGFDLDATNNTITYSLTSNPDGLFQIDANTGVVTTAAAIDREVHGALRSITVQASSSDGSTATQSFNITLNDLDEYDVSTPTDSDGATNEVDENVAIGTMVGVTANAFDLDATNNTINYSLTSNPDGLFQIDPNTGVVTTAASINREVHGALRSISVQASSSDGSVASQSFTISINDLDEFDATLPVDVDGTVNQVYENAPIGTQVGIVGWSFDGDATNNGVTYGLFDNDGGRFAIDASTGVVTVAGAINREADGAVRNITVRATSSDGSTSDTSFSINIIDVNEFNVGNIVDSDGAANSVNENVANGTRVGITALATDADATNNSVSYSLANNAGGRFAIDGLTGVVTVANGGLLDYETASSHIITIRATSVDGSFITEVMTILINDVNDEQVLATNSPLNVSEGGVGVIGNLLLATTDQDQGPANLTYVMTSSSANGVVLVNGIASSSFTQADVNLGRVSYQHDGSETSFDSFDFTVDDGFGVVSSGTFVIQISPANDAPVANDDSFTLSEGATYNGSSGALQVNDFDAENSPLSAMLVSGPVHGTLVLNSDGSFTYVHNGSETTSDSFQYHVSDGQWNSNIATVRLTIIPVNDAPVGVAESFLINAGLTLNELVGVLANDTDAEFDAINAILVNPPTKGVVLLRANGSFTYTPNAGFYGVDTFQYVPNDGSASGNLTTVTIIVNAVSQPKSETVDPKPDPKPIIPKPDPNPSTENEGNGVSPVAAIPTGQNGPPLQTEVGTVLSRLNVSEEMHFDDEVQENLGRILDRRQAENALRSIINNRMDELQFDPDDLKQLRDQSTVSVAFDASYLWEQINDGDDAANFDIDELRVGIGAMTAIGTFGYLIWSLRGGVLIAAALAHLPTWRMIDPLTLLDSYHATRQSGSKDQVEQLFE